MTHVTETKQSYNPSNYGLRCNSLCQKMCLTGSFKARKQLISSITCDICGLNGIGMER